MRWLSVNAFDGVVAAGAHEDDTAKRRSEAFASRLTRILRGFGKCSAIASFLSRTADLRTIDLFRGCDAESFAGVTEVARSNGLTPAT
jgi:hypothetical protein